MVLATSVSDAIILLMLSGTPAGRGWQAVEGEVEMVMVRRWFRVVHTAVTMVDGHGDDVLLLLVAMMLFGAHGCVREVERVNMFAKQQLANI